jgi:hypothetical protein
MYHFRYTWGKALASRITVLRKFGYRIAGTALKKHRFGLEDAPHWTVLVLDLDRPVPDSTC